MTDREDQEEREGKLGGWFLIGLLVLVFFITIATVVGARALADIARAADRCMPAVTR